MLIEAAGNPILHYFPFAGRGELTRLIAAAGGVTLDQPALPEDRKELCESMCCVGTGVPCLQHGDLKMCQSGAIQGYISLISPKFEELPESARAIDLVWAAQMEDFIGEVFGSGIGPVLFAGAPLTDEVKDKCKAALEKWFALFESLSPADGFVNKQAFPTAADCVAVYYYYAAAPNKAVFAQSGFDPSAYPRFKASGIRSWRSPHAVPRPTWARKSNVAKRSW